MNIFQCGIVDQTMNSFMSQQDKTRLFIDLPVTNHKSLQQQVSIKEVSYDHRYDHRYKESSYVKN